MTVNPDRTTPSQPEWGNMRCSKCGRDNRQGRKFCTSCGTPLIAACPKCGAPTQPDESFCGECGTALGDAAAAAAGAGTVPVTASGDGERRHLTVLFCDLVGSTEIASRLDPEEWRETVAAYHRAAAEAITRYGGHVAKYLGDGVMAFFGYPQAHDNDAERAAWAGLAMLDAIAKLGDQAGRTKLAARVGIDSGAVVVGAGAGKEADVFGEAPNIAARVQAAAEPGTVLITDAVHKLVSGLFVVESRGASVLKGVERLLQVYRIVQPSGVRGRLEAAAVVRGLTPFVGREDELRLLNNRWEHVLDDEGQVVLVIGEAGIGKSRLLQRFHEQLLAPFNWLEAAATPFFQNTPFHAIAEVLHQLVGEASLSDTDAPVGRAIADDGEAPPETRERLAQLESVLVMAGLKSAEAIPLIAPLLNLPAAVKYQPPPCPPEQQRRRLLAMLVEWVLGVARVQPLVIAIEDLHWADASTLELLQLLAEQGATANLLLLCTARAEFHPQWPLRAHHAQINLNRLSTRNVREMIAQVAARDALAGETVDAVIERTGGVPLFVEELTLAVLESGSAKLAGGEIPVTLHDSLMARLDRLGPAKEVIQIGAVIGSEFSYELLHAIHPVGAEELHSALRSATDAELVYVRGIAPEATYRFKHALIRDAAYGALLKSRRKDLHRLIAQMISEKFQALMGTQPEVLARHWSEAGETAQAISEWTRAGKAAESHQAFKEAQQSYEQALALLSLLPESAERDLHELDLRQFILQVLWMTAGTSSAEFVDARARAFALTKKSGSLSQLFFLMYSKGTAAFVAGDYETAAKLADEMLEFAEREGNPTGLGLAYDLQVMTRHSRGDLAGAEEHFARGLKFFEDNAAMSPYPFTPIEVFGFASWNAVVLGRAELARERLARVIAAANQNKPAEVAFSAWFGASTYFLLRENERAEMLAARALELSEKHQIPYIAEYARLGLGLARAELGRPSEGVALIRRAITSMAGMGTRGDYLALYLPHAQALLGALAEALETIEPVLQPNRSDANIFRPMAFRLRGELQVKQGRREPAEADFRTALTLARRMGAKVLELKATMSLAGLLRDTGRRDQARTMLAEIYNWFTEGFDTTDLKDAKALLDELSV